ncbi:MAG: hypothetical protein LUE20_04925 [Oscillospiraceae bacterium]|nr:hypothetical protein [Oscillospiraceae bacterium]
MTLKDGQLLNQHTKGTELIEIEFIPKGTKKTIRLLVYAKNRLDASNYLIFNGIYGKQVSTSYVHHITGIWD